MKKTLQKRDAVEKKQGGNVKAENKWASQSHTSQRVLSVRTFQSLDISSLRMTKKPNKSELSGAVRTTMNQLHVPGLSRSPQHLARDARKKGEYVCGRQGGSSSIAQKGKMCVRKTKSRLLTKRTPQAQGNRETLPIRTSSS